MPGNHVQLLRADRLRAGIDIEAWKRLGPGIVAGDWVVGVTRDQLTVPISPTRAVNDTVVFEDPADAQRRYYLPRYRLRASEAGRYEITSELADGLWRMTFGLESFPESGVEAAGPDLRVLPHQLAVSVTSGAEMVRDYPVAELTTNFTDAGVRPEVVLLLGLADRDALLRAFTQDADHARIEVRRSVSVAVPALQRRRHIEALVTAEPDTLGTPVILPDLVLEIPVFNGEGLHGEVPDPGGPEPDPRITGQIGAEQIRALQLATPVDGGLREVTSGVQVAVDGGLRQQVVVDAAFSRSALVTDLGLKRLAFRQPIAPALMRRAPALQAAEAIQRGGVLGHLRDVVDLRALGDIGIFVEPVGGEAPSDPSPVEPRYSVVSSDQIVDIPLRFDFNAHPYLFPAGQPSSGEVGFTTNVVPWPGHGPTSRGHAYFRDETAGNVFYYLPDCFLIGQRDEAPFGPQLSFTVGRTTDKDGGSERAIALMSVHLVPQVSAARLLDAATQLREQVVAGTGEPDLRPAVHAATCRLELPGGAITTSAPPDLVNGWWVAETFPFDDLRDVYAVLTSGGGASALLRGRVDVDIDGQVHQVPVELRLDRLSTPALSWTEKQVFDAQRSVTVTVVNGGNVTLTIPALPCWVERGEAPVQASVVGEVPAELAPGASFEVSLNPTTRPTGEEDSHALLDLTAVRGTVDPDRAVEQTLDRRVTRLPRVVTLLTTVGGLGSSGDPAQDLAAIGLQFGGVTGATLLTATALQRDVAIPVPLVDWLLDRGGGEFTYKQTLVRLSGSSQTDDDWRRADTALLVLPQAPA